MTNTCYDLKKYAGRILTSMQGSKNSDDHTNNSFTEDPHKGNQSSGGHLSQFLPTSRRIVQFSNGKVCFQLSWWSGKLVASQ